MLFISRRKNSILFDEELIFENDVGGE